MPSKRTITPQDSAPKMGMLGGKWRELPAGLSCDQTAPKRIRKAAKAPKPPEPSEYASQAALIAWWRLYAPTKGIDERLLMASNGGAVLAGNAQKRGIQMNKLKASGYRVGTPDLMLAWPKFAHMMGPVVTTKKDFGFFSYDRMVFAGLYVEMKRKGGKASPEQLEMADLLRRAGYSVCITYGFDEAKRAIEGYLS